MTDVEPCSFMIQQTTVVWTRTKVPGCSLSYISHGATRLCRQYHICRVGRVLLFCVQRKGPDGRVRGEGDSKRRLNFDFWQIESLLTINVKSRTKYHSFHGRASSESSDSLFFIICAGCSIFIASFSEGGTCDDRMRIKNWEVHLTGNRGRTAYSLGKVTMIRSIAALGLKATSELGSWKRRMRNLQGECEFHLPEHWIRGEMATKKWRLVWKWCKRDRWNTPARRRVFAHLLTLQN